MHAWWPFSLSAFCQLFSHVAPWGMLGACFRPVSNKLLYFNISVVSCLNKAHYSVLCPHLTDVNLTKSEYPHSAFREFPPWGGGGGEESSQLIHYYNAVSPVLWQKYTNSAESKKWALNKISRRYQNQGRCLKAWLDSKEKNKWTAV